MNARYEIARRIGGGGMGAVYLAKDRNLGDAPRAVKEMVEAHLDPAQHEKAIGDFKRESLLLTSLEHPSIPTIYDYFYDEQLGRFYLVMKFISGGDLASRLRNAPGGRIDEKTVTDWGMQIADVLQYLHSRPKPIIYRDLKPANLMIDGNTGRVMLIDFGIARWVKQEEKGVTAVGTMGYAPPELFGGRVEPRSDVYSFGATMFHLLTGSDPQDNPLLIFDFAKNPRPRQITPSLSSEMEQILMRSVEYKPEDRFASAGAMRDALAHHLEKLMAGQVSLRNSRFAHRQRDRSGANGLLWFLRRTNCRRRYFLRALRSTTADGRSWIRARLCELRVRLRNWWWPELPNSTPRLFCRKTTTFWAGPIRIQTFSRRSIFQGLIRKQKFLDATLGFGVKVKRFWLKISVR